MLRNPFGRLAVPLALVAAVVAVAVFAGVRLAQRPSTSPAAAADASGQPVVDPSADPADAGNEPTASDEPSPPSTVETDRGGAPPLTRSRAAEEDALAIVRSLGDVAEAGFISRRELVESFTTEEFGPAFASETGRQVDTLVMELGARGVDRTELIVHEQPVTVTSNETDNGVTVRVWSVMVVVVPGMGPGRQVWRTITLDMVEVDERWLLDGWRSAIGPTPAPPAEGLVDTAESIVETLEWRRVDIEGS